NRDYVDSKGAAYSFSRRWNPQSPVGYANWTWISDHEDEVEKSIPKEFPDQKPEVLAELEARKGFGTIWALFVMHCFYPQTYPLFDQHVYRAYRSIVTLQKECPVSTCTAWADYTGYRNFFLGQVEA